MKLLKYLFNKIQSIYSNYENQLLIAKIVLKSEGKTGNAFQNDYVYYVVR
ncbi:hypothetical protein SAMN04488089_105166 [Myroides profundi]|uniref:Uncharacterized protein n=1 Tax=Myroides profundi TaxID=480520 RepID=A0AAJ4W3B1_MYRPR|nr:hypothetical protein MPR_2704 [Myroides profundi]SEQ72542.1 hypothetical protein SAMN04488089_105166 [Myroides profundi]